MQAFFNLDKYTDKTNPSGKVLSCISCGLYRGCNSPKMEAYGEFRKNIMVIGEAPGEVEDGSGKPWQGKAGRVLQEALDELGVDLFKDCLSLNAVNCRPKKNRTPTKYEMDCCRMEKVEKAINQYHPQVIIVLGGPAVYSLIGHRWKKDLGGITKWRGWTIPDVDYKAWICPTFHPSFVMRMDTQEIRAVWKQDLLRAVKKAEEPLPRYKKPKIRYLDDLRDLNQKPESGMIAFDYETTGLKTQRKEQELVCASVAYDEVNVDVFMIPEKKTDREPFVELLANPEIGKIASNMKFEHAWTRDKLKLDLEVRGWEWDTMIAAHVLDNRPGVTGLKFQAYVQLGIVDYDSEVAPYLKPKKGKGGNLLNQVLELISTEEGKRKLLHYCALDSVYEYRVAMQQMKQMDWKFMHI